MSQLPLQWPSTNCYRIAYHDHVVGYRFAHHKTFKWLPFGISLHSRMNHRQLKSHLNFTLEKPYFLHHFDEEREGTL